MAQADKQPRTGCRPACLWSLTGKRNLIFKGVKTKRDIIEELAKGRRVELLVENIAHSALTADLKDLCQMVYLILLEYDDAKIQDLYENDQINFFLVRIILNQYRSSNSPFHTEIRKFQEKCVELGAVADMMEDAG